MPSAREVDAEREDYVVSVVEFAGDTERALHALQRLFALSEADARTILREAPVAVRRGVNRIRAEYFRRALELAGARVEVRDAEGELVQAQAPPEPRAAQRPAPEPSPPQPKPQAAPVSSAAALPSSPLTAAALRESARASPFGATLVMGSAGPAQYAGPPQPSGDVAGSPLDLRPRESAPQYDPIPAGERWKAPGARTVAKVHRKQQVQALESGMGDMRPSPRPPGMAEPHPSPSGRAVAPLPNPTVRESRTIATDTQPGFAHVAGLLLSGSGLARILVVSAGSFGLGLIAKLCERLPWLGAPLFLLALSLLLAICVEYQRSVFWAVATGDSELESKPLSRVAELIRNGLYPTSLAALSHGLLWIWLVNQLLAGRPALSIVSSPALWVLGLGPGFYWPIALGCAAARNHIRGIWDIGQGLRALGRAPLAIAQVALASGGTFAIGLWLSTAVLSALQLGPAFTLCAASGLPLALSHGLMGTWLGGVLRSQPELFD